MEGEDTLPRRTVLTLALLILLAIGGLAWVYIVQNRTDDPLYRKNDPRFEKQRPTHPAQFDLDNIRPKPRPAQPPPMPIQPTAPPTSQP